MQVQVIGKPLRYNGRLHPIGHFAEMSAKHARLFMAIGRVRLPQPPRADIPASPSTPVTVVETAEVETEKDESDETVAPAQRPRRQYRRRDIRPENRDPRAED